MPMINLELEPEDHVLPCPFCGRTVLELCNTWTASYWIECGECGASAHGEAFGGNIDSSDECNDEQWEECHAKAKASALAAWNRRTPKACEAQARLERATSAALGVGILPVEIGDAVGAIVREHVYDAAQCGIDPHKAEALVYELIIATAEAARPVKP